MKEDIELFLGFVATYAVCVAVGTYGGVAIGLIPAIGAIAGQLAFLGLFIVWAGRRTARERTGRR